MAVSFTQGNDFIVPTEDGQTYLGGAGDDTYMLSSATVAAGATIVIQDTEGTNQIQLVGGLEIASSEVFNNAIQLTLSNGALIQILGAASFGYDVGGNALAGTTGTEEDFATFVTNTLVATVPAEGEPSSAGGAVTIAGGDVTPPVDEFSLTEALADLQAAQDNLADFLAPLELDTNYDGTIDVVAGDATVQDVIDASDAVAADLAAARGVTSDAALNAALANAQNNLDAAEADMAAFDAALPAAKDALVVAQENYKSAIDVTASEYLDLEAEVAKSEALSTGATGLVVAQTADALAGLVVGDEIVQGLLTAGELDAAGALENIIVLGENGVLEAAAGVDTTTVPGYAAILAEAQEAYDAALEEVSAQEVFEGAIAAVLDIEADGWDELILDADTSGGTITQDDTGATGTTADTLYIKDGELYLVRVAINDNDIFKVNEITIDDFAALDTVTSITVTIDSDDPTAMAVNDVDLGAGYVALGADPDTFTVQATETVVTEYYDAAGDFADGGGFTYAADFSADAPLTQDVFDKEDAVETAQAPVDERNELIADANAAAELETEAEALQDVVDDAELVLTDEGYSILGWGDAATAADDIYLYEATDTAITGFGDEGDDVIFVGTDFAVFTAAEGDVIGDNLGDVSALEVIVIDDGANTTLYFEGQTFAGNAASAADIDAEVTLTGVTGATVGIDADGFLSIA